MRERFSAKHSADPTNSKTAPESQPEPAVAVSAKSDNEIQTTGVVDQPAGPLGEVAESIVARVNADVILRETLFTPIRPQLAKAQQELRPAEFAQYQSNLMRKQLRDLIERQLLIQEAKRQIPEAGIKRLEALGDKEFGKQIELVMKRMEVNTEAELRRKMLEGGESLDQSREFQRGTFLAQWYLRNQLGPKLDVSREEMVDYHNLHRDQFKKEGGVLWSEIFVSVEKAGSKQAARAKVLELRNQLLAGANFAALARTESEGATAGDGGSWELTTKGSYVVAAVDEAIFSLPVGQLSGAIEGPKGYHLVQVHERKTGTETSFVDAQDEIRKAIKEQKIQKESQQYVQELARKAHITTIFGWPIQPVQTASNAK